MAGTGSETCPVAGFGLSGVEPCYGLRGLLLISSLEPQAGVYGIPVHRGSNKASDSLR